MVKYSTINYYKNIVVLLYSVYFMRGNVTASKYQNIHKEQHCASLLVKKISFIDLYL